MEAALIKSRLSTLFFQNATEDAAGHSEEGTCAAFASLKGDENVVDIYVSVTVLVFDDAGKLAYDGRNESTCRCGLGVVEPEFICDGAGENLACESRYRAGSRSCFAGEKFFDCIEASCLGSSLGETAENGF